MKSKKLILILATLIGVALTSTLRAQLVADGGTLSFTRATNLPGDLVVGTNGGNTMLTILAPGTVTNANGTIGLNAASTNNQVRVENRGAVWQNTGALYVGVIGSGNRLIVTNGGVVAAAVGLIGYNQGASGNLAMVSGAGSVWTNSGNVNVGEFGSGNQLVVSNGGVVVNTGNGVVGYDGGANNNLVTVTGAGSLWIKSAGLYVGSAGSGSQLLVSNEGKVQAANVYAGWKTSSTNNRVIVDGGNLIVTNSGGTGTLDIRRGTNVLNAGLVRTDRLLVTNSAGFFEFNGGTLITRGTTVNNGSPFVVGNGSSATTYQLAGNGLHTFTDGLVISAAATLTGNGTVAGPLTVQSRGTVMPGNPIGKLVLNNSPTLQGSVLMEISKTGATLTNDQIQVAAPLTYGGNLAVSKLGSNALAIGDSFRLFSAPSYGGAFTGMSLPSPGPGLMWTNQLLLNGSIAVVAQTSPAISGLVKSGTSLMFNVSRGSPGGAYDVLTSTNVALPLSSWTTNSTGNFDWMGNTTITNAVNLAEPERYFSVQAFNTGNLLP